MIKVEAFDQKGRPVPTANEKIVFRISGAGRLIGVGNGDPNCLESDKEPKRSLFNGLAQAIVQSSKQVGSIRIEAVAEGGRIKPAALVIRTKSVALRPFVS
jgi:beta-galactosidase